MITGLSYLQKSDTINADESDLYGRNKKLCICSSEIEELMEDLEESEKYVGIRVHIEPRPTFQLFADLIQGYNFQVILSFCINFMLERPSLQPFLSYPLRSQHAVNCLILRECMEQLLEYVVNRQIRNTVLRY